MLPLSTNARPSAASSWRVALAAALAALAPGGCAGPATVTWLSPLEGEVAPPLRAYLTLASPAETAALLGKEAVLAGVQPAWLVLENRDPAPVALALPLQLGLRDRHGEELANAVGPELVLERLAGAGVKVEPAELLRRLREAAAPLSTEVPGGERRRGLVLLAPAAGAAPLRELIGLTFVVRVAPAGQRAEPLVGGELRER